MTDTRTRRMISALPSELQPGDIIRDWGIDRTIKFTTGHPAAVASRVIVHFEADPGLPDAPSSLAIEAHVTVTAWRTDHG